MLTKGFLLWLLLVALAVINGVARERLLIPLLGPGPALPLSGLTLALLVLLFSWLAAPLLAPGPAAGYLGVGLLWVVLTLAFEYLFGHYVLGRPWQQIHRVFDVTRGDLFLLVLLVSAVAPWLAARLRRLL